MDILGVKNVQICPFKGTAPATSCCTPKGTILNPILCMQNRFQSFSEVVTSPRLLSHRESLT